MLPGRPVVEMKGRRFGRLVVFDSVRVKGSDAVYWRCKCDCGLEAIIRGNSLRSGATRSCGCLRAEKSSEMGKRPRKTNNKTVK